MTAKTTQIGIAILSATAGADGWYQLLPAGRFHARDGRPHDVSEGWQMDAGIAARLIDGVRALGQDVLIDYEHNQLRKNEGLAPEALAAAGWFNADEMEWRENRGLFIKPRWTPAAQKRVDDHDFAFLSAVFPYDITGTPLELRMAALTNDPGVTGMERLAALAAEFTFNHHQPQERSPMNEILRQLLAKLGIDVAEGAEPTDEQLKTALATAEDALTAKKNSGDQVAALSAEITTLKASSGKIDLTKYVPVETYNAMRDELKAMSGEHSTATLSAVLDAAEQDGRIFKSERSYFSGLGEQIGTAALSAQLETRQPIAALSAMQTTKNPPSDKSDSKKSALTAEEKEAARVLGKSEAEYLKLKQEADA